MLLLKSLAFCFGLGVLIYTNRLESFIRNAPYHSLVELKVNNLSIVEISIGIKRTNLPRITTVRLVILIPSSEVVYW